MSDSEIHRNNHSIFVQFLRNCKAGLSFDTNLLTKRRDVLKASPPRGRFLSRCDLLMSLMLGY